ncbi:MAG: type II toxin-antitoxin system ParD family antitoxin [Alphaproteobacteria bacterium]|nr:type II toxin-antitoxin system ParD family antitoxin [Alphaproteobacteria bacterium]MDP6567124.1 type II toxin-antitoxin system ParD family antitoxin [Alphaproteobacteria bacterium]MDP6813968.1 type II toxin-antitoxin system ParD family antitoxin [Alphaproteobacteria bacterium]
MNISLNQHLEHFIEQAVRSGRYKSSSEVVRAGLRLLEEREARLEAVRREIAIGRESGEPRPFDPEGIKRRGRRKLSKTG